MLLSVLLIAVAISAIVRAVAFSRARTARNLAAIEAYGFGEGEPRGGDARVSTRTRLDNLATTVGGFVAAHMRSLDEAQLRKELVAAGMYMTRPRKFVGYQALSTITVPVVLGWLTARAGVAGIVVLPLMILAGLAGWRLPRMVLHRRAKARLERIDDDLPELIDLLVVTVEAGLGFVGSLRIAADRLDGPLAEELRLALQEQNMGLSTDEALRNTLERADTPAMRAFVRSIIQGEALGVSIGQIMRNLAIEMRKRRRQAAEERAQKAPVKILFPLVFLIFPAMFIVLLAPAVIQLLRTF